jgi:hypothetical protein
MGELSGFSSTSRTRERTVRVVGVAERQWGVVTRGQLEASGLPPAGIRRWIERRRLHRIYPGVYALGHRVLRVEGRLAAALLYAGPGAMLSHATAAWWLQLLPDQAGHIHVSAPGDSRSLPDVRVHHPRRLARVWRAGLPVTSPARTLLDIAGVVPFYRLRKALAEAEYLRVVTLDEVEQVLGRGRPGSAALRKALEQHRPQLARTRSVLEERFLALCETHSLPLPDVNLEIAGLTVDAVWEERMVVAELDGLASHATPARMEADRRRDLTLRRAGYTVLRYTWQQIAEQPEAVAVDLLRHL